MKRFKFTHIGIGATLVLLCGIYLLMMKPHVVGFYYDDGIYVIGSKALAHGLGYVELGLPGNPAIVKYPPLLSLILTPIWWIFPKTPDNIPLFKGTSILFAIGFLYLFAVLFQKANQKSLWISLGVMLALGIDHALLDTVLTVMSEPLFLLFSLSFWGLLQSISSTDPIPSKKLRWLIGVSVLAFYTRTIGMVLILTGTVWLWLQGKKGEAKKYGGYSLLASLPWFLWTTLQPPLSFDLGNFRVISYNQSYLQEWLLEIHKARGLLSMVVAGVPQLLENLARTLLPVLVGIPNGFQPVFPFVGLVITLLLVKRLRDEIIKKAVSFCTLYVVFYLIFITFWGAHDQYQRLLVGILPFLWITVFALLDAWRMKYRAWIAALLIITAIWGQGVWLINRYQNYRGDTLVIGDTVGLWTDYQEAFQAINQYTKPSDVIWSRKLAVFPVYTDRKFVAFNFIPLDFYGDLSKEEIFRVIRESMNRAHIRYILSEPIMEGGWLHAQMDKALEDYLRNTPDRFRLIYQSSKGFVRLYEVLKP